MSNRIYTAAAALLLMGLVLACTIPVYFASAPDAEENVVYVEITSTPEEAEDAAETSTETNEDAMVSVNLDGAWTIWQGTEQQQLDSNFLQKGFDLIANAATGDGHSIMFSGKISSDGNTVNGTWESTNGTSGNFMMEMHDSLNSFAGNLGGGVPFCGTRLGSARPNPCLK